jgi:hypothetical protein
MSNITKAEDAGNRAEAIRLAADAAGDAPQARMAVIRQALSDRRMDVAAINGCDLAAFVGQCWQMGINPLPAFRKRLGPQWAVIAHCWATSGLDPETDYQGEAYVSLKVGASEIMFRRLV